MTITITIADAAEGQILRAIEAAQGWTRGNNEDTAERITGYMSNTVGQWVASGTEIMAREAAAAELAQTIAGAIAIAVK